MQYECECMQYGWMNVNVYNMDKWMWMYTIWINEWGCMQYGWMDMNVCNMYEWVWM